MAEHGDGARLDDLDPDEAAHQGRLARARRPEQTHDLAGGDLEVEPGDDAALAAHDLQAAHGDRRSTVIHHVMKSTPRRRPVHEMLLEHRSDALDELLGGRVGDRRDADDVAGDDEPDHLRGRERAAQLRVGGSRARGDASEDLAAEELTQHPRRLLARHARPDEGHERVASLRRLPDRQEGLDDPPAEPVDVARGDPLDELGRVDRHVEGLGEERRLALEVVVHERRVDPGLPGDAAHARLVVSLGREGLSRRVDDRGARVGAAGAASAPLRRRLRCRPSRSCPHASPRRGAASRPRARWPCAARRHPWRRAGPSTRWTSAGAVRMSAA